MNIKQVTSRMAGQLAGAAVPLSGPAAESMVADLLRAQDEQVALLTDLRSRVDLLADGPWQTARLYLREALLPGRPPGQAAAALTQAAGQLRSAVPLQPPVSFQRAQVLADLAIVQRFLADGQLAAHYAAEAYWLARRAMGQVLQREFGGRLPSRSEGLARLSLAGAAYDAIEWSAAAVGDPSAGRVVSVSDGEARFSFDAAGVTWTSAGPLDFAYVAYFQLLLDRVRGAEAVGAAATISQQVRWLRFRDQDQVEHPRHPPLPPPALLEDSRVILRELQLLAVSGRL